MLLAYIKEKREDRQMKKDIERFDKLMRYAADMAAYRIPADTEIPE